MGGAYSKHGAKRNAYRVLMGKPKGKRRLGRPRGERIILRWISERERERERGWGVMDWIDLAQYRNLWRDLVKTVMNFRVP
jgi:hypothetical protein